MGYDGGATDKQQKGKSDLSSGRYWLVGVLVAVALLTNRVALGSLDGVGTSSVQCHGVVDSGGLASDWCIYENLYYDAGAGTYGTFFLDRATDGQPATGCRIHHQDFVPHTVRRPPPESDVHIVAENTTLIITDMHHGNYAHTTLEQLFAQVWAITELDPDGWSFKPNKYELFHWGKKMFVMYPEQIFDGYNLKTGEVKGFYRYLMPAIASAEGMTTMNINRVSPQHKGIFLIPHAVCASTTSGRSMWNHKNYPGRELQAKWDHADSYDDAARAIMFRKYSNKILNTTIGMVREDRQYSLVDSADPRPLVNVLNRPKSHGRNIANDAELCQALRGLSTIRVAASCPANLGDLTRSLTDSIAAFRALDIAVMPHGANEVNLMWMRPGSGVVEIIASNGPTGIFQVIADALLVHFETVLGHSQAHKHPLTVPAAQVLAAVKKVAVAVAGEKSSNALDHVQQNLGSVNSGASAANADEVQSLKRALKEEIASRKAKIEDLETRLMAVTGGDADGK